MEALIVLAIEPAEIAPWITTGGLFVASIWKGCHWLWTQFEKKLDADSEKVRAALDARHIANTARLDAIQIDVVEVKRQVTLTNGTVKDHTAHLGKLEGEVSTLTQVVASSLGPKEAT